MPIKILFGIFTSKLVAIEKSKSIGSPTINILCKKYYWK